MKEIIKENIFEVIINEDLLKKVDGKQEVLSELETLVNTPTVKKLEVTRKSIVRETIDFKGKFKDDGDLTRQIWFTEDFSEDQPSENIGNQVNTGYQGVSTKNDGTSLSLEVISQTEETSGKQIQFEFGFNLLALGETYKQIASNIKSIKFNVTSKGSLDFNVKSYNPHQATYGLLGTHTSPADIYKVTGAYMVNVRQEPNGLLLGAISEDTLVEVLNIDGGNWAKIKYNGGCGYMSADYLELVSLGNAPETLSFELDGEFAEYISTGGFLRFGIMSVGKSTRYIPLEIAVDHVELIIEYIG